MKKFGKNMYDAIYAQSPLDIIKYRNMHNMWLIWSGAKMTLIIPKLIFIWFQNNAVLFLCLLSSFGCDRGIDYYKCLSFFCDNKFHSFLLVFRSSTRVNESHVFSSLLFFFLMNNSSSRRWNISALFLYTFSVLALSEREIHFH
jgi:hypothetical protein